MVQVPEGIPGGYERYLAPNGPNGAYYPQAQFVSSRGFGFLLNQPEYSRWRMGNDRRDAWQVQVAAKKLDYTVALGPTPRAATRTLTAITGRHRLPPAWAQGSILVRAVSVPPLPGLPATETAATYRAKVEQDLADMQRYGVRPSAYSLEGWALLDDLDYVRELIRRLRAMGVRTVVYHRAYVSNDALSTQPRGDYEDALQRGLVATTAAGTAVRLRRQRRRPGHAARLHEAGDGALVEAAPRAAARRRRRRLHAGLRRAGAGGHALRRRQHRRARCTTATP